MATEGTSVPAGNPCRYCQNLRVMRCDEIDRIEYTEFVQNISSTDCYRCQLLHGALRELQPEFLENTGWRDLSRNQVGLHVSKNGKVNISTFNDESSWNAAAIQLYSTSGKIDSVCT